MATGKLVTGNGLDQPQSTRKSTTKPQATPNSTTSGKSGASPTPGVRVQSNFAGVTGPGTHVMPALKGLTSGRR